MATEGVAERITRRSVMQWSGAALAMPVAQFHASNPENRWMTFTPKFVDLVRNIASVIGSGPVTLGQAVSGFSSLADAVGAGEQFYYCLQGVDKPQEREVGRGTMQSDGKVARLAIANALTNFTSGAKTIALVTPAEWFARADGAMASAANRAELAGKDPATDRAMLAERGRAGTFLYDPSNMSAMVAADPRQGMVVAPASAPTGASGAWVRAFSGSVNVKWFGAVGDGTTNDGPAFNAALAFLGFLSRTGFGYSRAIPELHVPFGHYFLGNNTLDITYTMRLSGEGVGGAGGAATVLRWDDGVTGIRVQRVNTTGNTGTQAATDHGGDGSIIQGLFLKGGYVAAESENHGILMRAAVSIRDCYVHNFPGDGIHINASIGGGGANPEGAANVFEVTRCRVEHCRKGLYVNGADGNAGSVSFCAFDANRTWGVDDSSFLGNTYLACHAAGNGWDGGLGSIPTACTYSSNRYYVMPGQAVGASTNAPSGTTASNTWWGYIGAGGTYNGIVAWVSGTTFREGGSYKTDDANAQSVFMGCYTEGDQNPAQVRGPATVSYTHLTLPTILRV